MKKKRALTGVMTVGGLLLALLFMAPILILLSNSFKSLKDIYLNVLALPNGETFTWKNYPEAFEKLEFAKSFLNSLGITLVSTVLLLIYGSVGTGTL